MSRLLPTEAATGATTGATTESGRRWATPARRKLKNRVFQALCLGSLLVALVLLAVLLFTLFRNGVGVLDLRFFEGMPSSNPRKAGVKAAVLGSLYVVALSSLVAIPVGIAAAIYLEEFTHRKTRFTNFLQVNIANLSGVPSIIYGLLGLALFVRVLNLHRSLVAGALTMAVLILPTVILVSQEALKAVPGGYRDASLALGTTRWQTIRYQVLPSAMPGIVTGIILSISRALGETAPLITIGAVQALNFVPTRLSDGFTVLPIQIFDWATRPRAGFSEKAAGAIVVLLVLLLALNSVAIVLRARATRGGN